MPLREMGMLAAQMVLKRIQTPLHNDARPSRVILAGRPRVTRRSSAPPRAGAG